MIKLGIFSASNTSSLVLFHTMRERMMVRMTKKAARFISFEEKKTSSQHW
jgi:hypothetical protein